VCKMEIHPSQLKIVVCTATTCLYGIDVFDFVFLLSLLPVMHIPESICYHFVNETVVILFSDSKFSDSKHVPALLL
jgi:hypothetical protein